MRNSALAVLCLSLFAGGFLVGKFESPQKITGGTPLDSVADSNSPIERKDNAVRATETNSQHSGQISPSPPNRPSDSPSIRWRNFSLRATNDIHARLDKENLALTTSDYAPLEQAAESGNPEAAFQLYLLHRTCASAALTSEDDIQRQVDQLNEYSSDADQQQILDLTKRFFLCEQFEGNHKVRAYHFLSLAAQYRYPLATLTFLTDSRRLIQDQLFRYPELVTEHLIQRESVIQEAAVSCVPTVLMQLSMEFSSRGTLGTDLESRYLYLHLAELASTDPATQANIAMMVEGTDRLFAPSKLRDIRERARALHERSCID